MRKAKKHLNFQCLRQVASETFSKIPDLRLPEFTNYTIHDVLMSGFAMMYFQSSSLLQFQKELENSQRQSNLSTLFKVHAIPKSTQMRVVTDTVEPESFRPIYKEWFYRLQRGKHLQGYHVMGKNHLCVLDGSGYFGSEKLHCAGCLRKEHKDGSVSYAHQILQAALMHPDKKQVVPFMPEEIRNEDGQTKQDCELKAGKRLLKKIRKDHPNLELMIGGDALYAKQPLIEELESLRMHYLLVAKPKDHPVMMEWFYEQMGLGEVQVKEYKDAKGRIHRYEWINKIPINGRKEPKWVNFLRYFLIVEKNGKKKTTYKNSWVTDQEIKEDNLKILVAAGRCRWKIENECFNTLKNQGYQIEHNYGHGQNHLSFNFLQFVLLAFFLHQIFELTDKLYQTCRGYGSKRYLWELLRSMACMVLVDTWEELLKMRLEMRLNKDWQLYVAPP